MQLISFVDNDGWEAHNRADGRRSDETLVGSVKIRDLHFYTFISNETGIRHILSKHGDSFQNGVTVVTGYIDKKVFRLTGLFTPEKYRGNKYAQILLTMVVKLYGKVHGDSQNTKAGQATMDAVGGQGYFDYYKPDVVFQEEYLKTLETGSLSKDEVKMLKNKAHNVARIEVK